jgi:hypothetical protein
VTWMSNPWPALAFPIGLVPTSSEQHFQFQRLIWQCFDVCGGPAVKKIIHTDYILVLFITLHVQKQSSCECGRTVSIPKVQMFGCESERHLLALLKC